MKTRHLLVMVLVVGLLVMALHPAPAEAFDPMVAIAVAGAVAAVVVIVVYLVIANMEGDRRSEVVPPAAEAPVLVVYVTPAAAPDAP